jgi:hypothetical protein
MASPYFNQDREHWPAITQQLIDRYPLSLEEIRQFALESWARLWMTRIGEGEGAINLADIDVPAPVVGYFFERLLANLLRAHRPDEWRGQAAKDEKDLVYIPDRFFDTEIKSSGQMATKIFGNRSYGKRGEDETQVSKVEKSGYYITVNFHMRTLHLLRLGWIDFDDWKSQAAQTGQAATLSDEAYRYKLVEIPGEYRAKAPVGILPKVGPKTCADFAAEGVETVEQLTAYAGSNRTVLKFREVARSYLRSL